jgi:hypothetical protein
MSANSRRLVFASLSAASTDAVSGYVEVSEARLLSNHEESRLR